MKKIFGLIVLAFLFVQGTQAQNASLGVNDSYVYYVGGKTADNIGVSSDSTFSYIIEKPSLTKSTALVNMKLTRVAVGGTVTTKLYSKTTKNASWTPMDTIVWHKSTADTTFSMGLNATTVRGYYKIESVGSASTTKGRIEYIDFKVIQD